MGKSPDSGRQRIGLGSAKKKRGETQPPETVRQSKRHLAFGALKGMVIIPEGVDLTEPADPDWGKVYD